jgi:hypothetical protein
MILHFSHIGLTDGRTFTRSFRLIPVASLWLPVRPPLRSRGVAHELPDRPERSG